MIGIIDCGLGNIQAFSNIYSRLNIPFCLASSPEQLQRAEKIILPGVGSFDWAMNRLNRSGMRDVLDRRVVENQIPVLGICVGMQMMANSSEEGNEPGLGWIDAEVLSFNLDDFNQKVPLPHMGWNDVLPKEDSRLLQGIENPQFYFLHSYYFSPKLEIQRLATTIYGREFTSITRSKNIYGVQFHPEKSHRWGMQLLKNFSEL